MQNQPNIVIQLSVVITFFTLCLCSKDYDYNVRIEAGALATRPEKHQRTPEADLKDGEYGYKIYYDDGDYDFDDDSSQDEQEKVEGLCMIVNQTSKEIQHRNNKALEKMEKYMEIYVLANSLRDYAESVKKTMNDSSVNLTKEVDDAVESALRDHIDIEDLTHLYKTLVAIPDNDKAFKEGTDWKEFVIFQLESVKDYIGEHFQYFKRELPKFKTTRQFYKRRNFYVALGDRGGLMSIFYYWFDSRVCKPRMFDEAQIREKLKEHLKYLIDLPEHVNATKEEEKKPEKSEKPSKGGAKVTVEGKFERNTTKTEIELKTSKQDNTGTPDDEAEKPSEDAAAEGEAETKNNETEPEPAATEAPPVPLAATEPPPAETDAPPAAEEAAPVAEEVPDETTAAPAEAEK